MVYGWVIDSEPGKWENMMIFLQKSYVFEFSEEIYDTCSPKVFFCKKKNCGYADTQQMGCRHQNDLKS